MAYDPNDSHHGGYAGNGRPIGGYRLGSPAWSGE